MKQLDRHSFDEILTLYKSGGAVAVASEFHVSKRTVWRYLNANGVKPDKRRSSALDPEEIEMLIRAGIKKYGLVAYYRCSYATVRRFFKAHPDLDGLVGEVQAERKAIPLSDPWIHTGVTGRKVSLVEPDIEDIYYVDIANALDHQGCHTGQTVWTYSVLEHSVRVARRLSPHWRYEALMHEAHKAYIGSVSPEVQRVLRDYPSLLVRFRVVIARAMQLQLVVPEVVVEACERMRRTERAFFFPERHEPGETYPEDFHEPVDKTHFDDLYFQYKPTEE